MSDDKDRLIFMKELNRLSSEYDRCSDVRIKAEIIKDLSLLKEAIELLSFNLNAT